MKLGVGASGKFSLFCIGTPMGYTLEKGEPESDKHSQAWPVGFTGSENWHELNSPPLEVNWSDPTLTVPSKPKHKSSLGEVIPDLRLFLQTI